MYANYLVFLSLYSILKRENKSPQTSLHGCYHLCFGNISLFSQNCSLKMDSVYFHYDSLNSYALLYNAYVIHLLERPFLFALSTFVLYHHRFHLWDWLRCRTLKHLFCNHAREVYLLIWNDHYIGVHGDEGNK